MNTVRKDPMNPRGHLRNDDAFCFYCQVQYASPKSLKTHVFRKHPDSVRAVAFSPDIETDR